MPGIIFGVIVVIILCATIKIVSQTEAFVIEFLGKYSRTMTAGINFKIPFLERIAKKVNLKEQVGDFPPQPVITKDNVTMQIDIAVYYMVFDPMQFAYGVENPVDAMALLASTTLRNIIGDLELDETLTSRDSINAKMLTILDKATDKWGVKVTRVEIKNIIPPRDIQESMDKQMKAEREKRQTLLEAQAHREASITRAEGDKQAAILKAEAERDAAIARATGQAESIRLVYEAEAIGLEMLAGAGVNEQVIALKKLEALKELGRGQATKIVIPTDITNLATDMTLKGEMLDIADKASSTPPPNVTVSSDSCCDDIEKSSVTASLSAHERAERLAELQEQQRARNALKGYEE